MTGVAIELGFGKLVPLNAEVDGVVRLRHKAGNPAADGRAVAPICGHQPAIGPLTIQLQGLTRGWAAQPVKEVLLHVGRGNWVAELLLAYKLTP